MTTLYFLNFTFTHFQTLISIKSTVRQCGCIFQDIFQLLYSCSIYGDKYICRDSITFSASLAYYIQLQSLVHLIFDSAMYIQNAYICLLCKFTLRCIGIKWPMDEMADGHLGLCLNGRWPFSVGLDGRVSHFRLMTSPGLKLPTQSQMADDHILKFDILKFMIS